MRYLRQLRRANRRQVVYDLLLWIGLCVFIAAMGGPTRSATPPGSP
ncbi:hypothetical protein [Nonomuraea salmonea]